MDFKTELFSIIADFKDQAIAIDWEVVWDDEEKFELVLEILDTLINNIALLSDFDHSKRAAIVAQLAISRAQLTDCYGDDERYNYFQATTKSLDHALRDTILCSNWLTKAKERFDEYAAFEENFDEDTEITREKIDYYRPVMTALSLMNIITIDQEECDEDECDDEEE